jgi:predicted aldo/keto reductase-like oxidoreductase
MSSNFNRRKFLQTGAAATAGIIAGGCKTNAAVPGKSSSDKIIYRTLGKTGIKVPIVSMGVFKADNPDIIKACHNVGIRHFDTAYAYQNGRNEEMVGEVFKELPRESAIIATKFKPRRGRKSTKDLLEMLDTSLKRLQMEYVDILYLHDTSTVEKALEKDYLEALRIAKESGKARHIGVSTHSNMANVINAAVDSNFYEVVLTSYNIKLKDDKELHDAIKRASEAGLGVIGMKNGAGGYLDEDKKQPVNFKAALKWALSNPHIHTTIPGIANYEMLRENWSVVSDISLSAQEKKDLNFAYNETGMFCKGCHICNGQCPKNLPIPDLMRSYMYNYGYSSPAEAFSTVASLGLTENPCGDCTECSVKCSSGFNVKKKVTNIARIKNVPPEFLV